MSAGPPGPNGTTILTGPVGQVCAPAGAASIIRAAAIDTSRIFQRMAILRAPASLRWVGVSSLEVRGKSRHTAANPSSDDGSLPGWGLACESKLGKEGDDADRWLSMRRDTVSRYRNTRVSRPLPLPRLPEAERRRPYGLHLLSEGGGGDRGRGSRPSGQGRQWSAGRPHLLPELL